MILRVLYLFCACGHLVISNSKEMHKFQLNNNVFSSTQGVTKFQLNNNVLSSTGVPKFQLNNNAFSSTGIAAFVNIIVTVVIKNTVETNKKWLY